MGGRQGTRQTEKNSDEPLRQENSINMLPHVVVALHTVLQCWGRQGQTVSRQETGRQTYTKPKDNSKQVPSGRTELLKQKEQTGERLEKRKKQMNSQTCFVRTIDKRQFRHAAFLLLFEPHCL